MTFSPEGSYGNVYLPTYKNYTLEQGALQDALARDYVKIAYAVNTRTNGIFETVRTQCGDQYPDPDTNQDKLFVFRQLYTIDETIAAGASLTIEHGITNLIQFVRIYGSCITSVPDFRPLPHPSVTANANIEIIPDYTNITINNGAGGPDITSGTIVLEYLMGS